MISVDELLAPLPGDSPCGEDLSYDPALSDLETRLQGKAETQFAAAEEPNWRELSKLCLQLFTRTKDLRVAIALALVLLRTDDLPGFAQGMELLHGLLSQYWPTFYPRLDPADDDDPLERMNLMASVAAPEGTYGDPLRFVARLRQVPLCRSAVAGSFNLAQILAASVPAAPAAGEGGTAPTAPELSVIKAAFQDTPVEFLETQLKATESALAAVEAMDGFLDATVGTGNAANLDPLTAVLREIRTRLIAYAPALAAAEMTEDGVAAGGAAPGTRAAGGAPGTINSREDVVRALDAICAYYNAHEPSSPVAALLVQAKKLVGMGFLEILQALTPDATPLVRLAPPEASSE